MAQAHRVVAPAQNDIGRLSVVHFIYPPLDIEMMPLSQFLEPNQEPSSFTDVNSLLAYEDGDAINPKTLCTNHWFPHVKWIEFHQNQMMQYVLFGYINNL